jgi:hypothetical protein
VSPEVRALAIGTLLVTLAALVWAQRPPRQPTDPLDVCANDAVAQRAGHAACVMRCPEGDACLHPTAQPADGLGARVTWQGESLRVRVDGGDAAGPWHLLVGERPPAEVLAAILQAGHGIVAIEGAPDAATALDVGHAWLARLGLSAVDTVIAGRRASDAVRDALTRTSPLVTLGTGPRPEEASRCAALVGSPEPGVCAGQPLTRCQEDAACGSDRCVFAALPEPAAFGATCPPRVDPILQPAVPRWDVWLASPAAQTPAGRDTADGVGWGAAQPWRALPEAARGRWTLLPDATLADLWRSWASATLSPPR